MSCSEPSKEQCLPPTLATLADVITLIERDPGLRAPRRKAMLSALRTVARLLNGAPASIAADPSALRCRLAGVSHAAVGLSRGRWNNVRCLTLAALKTAGFRIMPQRASAPSAPAWKKLEASLPDLQSRCGLSRLITFCTGHAIGPTAVDAAVFERFREALLTETFARRPITVYRSACTTWNAAASSIAGWPKVQIPVPDLSRRVALPWSAFPDSFREGAEAYLNRQSNRDPFSDDYAESASASTIRLQRNQILLTATALVRSGVPAEQITGLAVLVEPENAKLALHYLYDRAGGKSTRSIHARAVLLHSIAKHWLKASPEQLQLLADLSHRLAIKKSGMTPKNRARLRQFDDKANLDALLGLPRRVLQQVKRADSGSRRDALRVMFAVAIELFIVAAIRVTNMASLEVGRHLVHARLGPNSVVHLVISEDEIKNDVPCELPLPAESAELLATYLSVFRPRLSAARSSWLFPNHKGKRRATTRFSTQIAEFIHDETGITMNAHLFRHLAMKLHFDAHPEDVRDGSAGPRA